MEILGFVKSIAALLLVASLIILMGILAKKLAAKSNIFSLHNGGIVKSVHYVDGKRKLIVVNFGDHDHLILAGPNNDLLIATKET